MVKIPVAIPIIRLIRMASVVASEEAAMLTMLFPINMVDNKLS